MGIPYDLHVNKKPKAVTLYGVPYELGIHDIDVTVATNYGESTGQVRINVVDATKPEIYDNQTVIIEESEVMNAYFIRGTAVNKNTGLPVITSPQYVSADLGQTFTYQITTTFVDSAQQVYSIINAPEGSSFNPSTGILTWDVITGDQFIPVTFTVGVTNSAGSASQPVTLSLNTASAKPAITADQTITIEEAEEMESYKVKGTNTTVTSGLPVITSPNTLDAAIGDSTIFYVDTNYIDPVLQTYEVSNISDSSLMSVTVSESGRVVVTVDQSASVNQTGKFDLTVTNSFGSVSQTVTVTYRTASTPLIVKADSTQAELLSTVTYQVDSQNPNRLAQSYRLLETINGAVFDTSTGVLSYTIPVQPTRDALPIGFTFEVTEPQYNVKTYHVFAVTLLPPDSFLPIIDDQTVVVEEAEEMDSYSIQGTNVHNNAA